jgi:hypothetical protein
MNRIRSIGMIEMPEKEIRELCLKPGVHRCGNECEDEDGFCPLENPCAGGYVLIKIVANPEQRVKPTGDIQVGS